MELMPRCIHGGRGSVFVLPHFAQQNFTNPAAREPISHRLPLPTPPPLAPAPAGLGSWTRRQSTVATGRHNGLYLMCFSLVLGVMSRGGR